jgi:hypothetical protein
MKRYVSILMALITILAVLAVSACAKPPAAEMENAAAAVTRAENEPNILTYAEETLRQARSSLTRMNDAASTKQYDEAKLIAQETINFAERAITEARTGAERAAEAARIAATQSSANAENLIRTVKASIAETEQALENAQNNIPLDASAIVYQIETAKELIQDAEASLAANNYKEAEDTAAEARSSISNAMSLIAEAARQSSRKK